MFVAEHFLPTIDRDYEKYLSQQMVAHGIQWLVNS